MEINKPQKQYFTKQLMKWHAVDNDRSLPWKEEKDPYRIWLSEVILQQTRAQQGLPYYMEFTRHYPAIKDMAGADDEQVFRLWQGLGYYNRCKNMLATARYVAHDLDGKFPDTYDDILKLKGVGPYTAAAIASFAYGLPHAVIDGNVFRVLARYFGIDTPFDRTEGKKQFSVLANELLEKSDSAGYNQAIMDLGATVCKPATPSCELCPLEKKCVAKNGGIINDLPVRSKKVRVRKRYFHYVIFICNDEMWLHKRTANDIWQNLYEPFLAESDKSLDKQELATHDLLKELKIDSKYLSYEGQISQRLTHRIIESRFFLYESSKPIKALLTNGIWVKLNRIKDFAFPKSIVSFFQKKSYF